MHVCTVRRTAERLNEEFPHPGFLNKDTSFKQANSPKSNVGMSVGMVERGALWITCLEL